MSLMQDTINGSSEAWLKKESFTMLLISIKATPFNQGGNSLLL